MWSEISYAAYVFRRLNHRMAVYVAWRRPSVRRKVLAATQHLKVNNNANVFYNCPQFGRIQTALPLGMFYSDPIPSKTCSSAVLKE